MLSLLIPIPLRVRLAYLQDVAHNGAIEVTQGPGVPVIASNTALSVRTEMQHPRYISSDHSNYMYPFIYS